MAQFEKATGLSVNFVTSQLSSLQQINDSIDAQTSADNNCEIKCEMFYFMARLGDENWIFTLDRKNTQNRQMTLNFNGLDGEKSFFLLFISAILLWQ